MKRQFRNYEESLFEFLKNHEETLAYLNAALQEEDPKIFLLALKDVLTAQEIDISAFAKESKITRQNVYRILSQKGNPRWESLTSLLDALGLQMYVSDKKRKIEPLTIDKKLMRLLSRQAVKQGISVDVLIHEKLSK